MNLGDFHSGFRAYNCEVLETIDYCCHSDDFVSDAEFLVRPAFHGYYLGGIPVPIWYSPKAFSIRFCAGLKYGCQALPVLVKYARERAHLAHFKIVKTAKHPGNNKAPDVKSPVE